MGVEWCVVCRDCKVSRNLDKAGFLNFLSVDAIRKQIEGGYLRYRAALLMSFLWQHLGHNCTVLSDTDEEDVAPDTKDDGQGF